MTYAPGGRTGSWQPWVAMGAAKPALEVLCRYFAVALAPRQFTVNAISPGLDRRQRVEHSAGSGTELHSELAPERMDSHAETRHAGRPRKCRRAALFGGSELDHRTNPGCGWRRLAHGCAPPAGNPATARCKRRPHRLAEQPSKTQQSQVSLRRSRPPSFAYFAPWMVLRDRKQQADFFLPLRCCEELGLRM